MHEYLVSVEGKSRGALLGGVGLSMQLLPASPAKRAPEAITWAEDEQRDSQNTPSPTLYNTGSIRPLVMASLHMQLC